MIALSTRARRRLLGADAYAIVLPREGEVVRAEHAMEGRVRNSAGSGAVPSVTLTPDSSPIG